MPTWAKVVLIFVAVIIVGFIAIGVAAFYWVHNNKRAFDATIAQGRAFGAGKDVSTCVDESLQHVGGGGIKSAVNARLFAKGCMEVAAASPTLCQTVPSGSEVMASATWAATECRRRGSSDQSACTQVMQELMLHCDATRRRGAGNS